MRHPSVPPSPTTRSNLRAREPKLRSGHWGPATSPATSAHPALASAILVGLLFLMAFLSSGRDSADHPNPTQPASAVDTARPTTPQPQK